MQHPRGQVRGWVGPWVALAIICLFLSFKGLAAAPLQRPHTSPAPAGPVICVDPGHPSETSAGTSAPDGTTENHINWVMALQVRDRLTGAGYRVVLTKTSEGELVTNRRRAEIANHAGAAAFLRLHCDAGAGGGFAVYYPDRAATKDRVTGPSAKVRSMSRLLALQVQQALAMALDDTLKDNGVKTDRQTFVGGKQGALTGSIFSKVPVVTVEMVVLQNPKDLAFIKTGKGQERMAQALAEGVMAFAPLPRPKAVRPARPALVPVGWTAAPAARPPSSPPPLGAGLQSKVTTLVAAAKMPAGVIIMNLSGKLWASVNPDHVFPTASVIKVLIMVEAYRRVEEGTLPASVRDRYVPPMMSRSDNAAANALIDRLGMSSINATGRRLGLTSTALRRRMLDFTARAKGIENTTTPRDMARLLSALFHDEAASSKDCDRMLRIMQTDTVTSKIPRGVPPGIIISHKTGTLDDVENDAGIVYCADGPYIICLFTHSRRKAGSIALCAALSKAAWKALCPMRPIPVETQPIFH